MHRNAPTTRIASQEELWVSRHAPSSASELAVHKKKVEEIVDWFGMIASHALGKAPILLLTGPTGAGKTISLHVVAKQFNIEVVEWINPLTDPLSSDTDFLEGGSRQQNYYKESQLSKFTEFLLRSNRYPSLTIFGNEAFKSKLLLVEDFPNFILRDPKSFHEILQRYYRKGAGPLVFIVSDTNNSSVGERVLFPPDVQTNLQISVIRFNPIAPTSMTKVLSKIATTELRQSRGIVRVPEAEVLEQLVVSSAGDIRSAINSLQFFCLNVPKTSKTNQISSSASRSDRKRSRSAAAKSSIKSPETFSDESAIGLRDCNLTLFRALGKILYCKRVDRRDSQEKCVELPKHLSQHYRDPLSMVPEEVVEKSHILPDGFTAFLHQNYLDFYENIEDIAAANEYLSDADHLMREWSSRSALEQYSTSVATRGLLFCNSARATAAPTVSGRGFKPLHKPQWFTFVKKFRENSESLRCLFTEFRLPATELATLLLPYMLSAGASNLTKNQAAIVKELGKFTNLSTRSFPEKFGERDLVWSVENEDEEMEQSKSSTKHRTNSDADNTKNPENSAPDEISTQLLISHNLDSNDDDEKIEDFDDD